MKKKEKEPTRVFVDSSVLFAAVLSPSGGSFRIFHEAEFRKIKIFITPYVSEEVETALRQTYPHYLARFREILKRFPFQTLRSPSEIIVKKCAEHTDAEDAPIVTGALAAKAMFLLTLDRKHLIDNIALQRAYPMLSIITPGDFIKNYLYESRN